MSELVILSAIAIGLSLGIFGSGGAILTLPALVYLLNYDDKSAIIGSLFIVACISTFGSIPHFIKNNVSFKHILYFALPGVLGSYLGALIGSMVESWLQFLLFLLLMIIAATKMLRTKAVDQSTPETEAKNTYLIISGTLVGFATGFVGVGGGFLIVPALIFLGRLPIAKATATSLVIIVIQSSVALLSYYQHSFPLFKLMDWQMLIMIAAVGISGSYLGLWLKKYLNEQLLMKSFGYFLILMACIIFADKILF